MPPHDETARVGSAGPARRPAPARARTAGSAAGRAPARSAGGGGGGRPPVKPPTGGNRPGGSGKGRPPGGGGKKKKKRTGKQKRRRWLKIISGAIVGMLVLLGVFVGVVYASTDVPSPGSITNKQTTIVYYADGVTEMARLSGGENRIEVDLEQVSEPARNAILAAENRNFYNDPGISFTGILRAAWNNLTGGSTQGGSTITQQYVKNAFLNSDQTFSRKFKELFLAVKLDNEYSKDDILENYLNTIYFGRGAYGIEAAANTYFGVSAADLTAEQGGVLAVLVRSPSSYDPANNPEGATDRWGLVMDAMVEQGWVDPAARPAMVYPAVLPNTGSNMGIPAGPEGLVVNQVLAELAPTYDDVEASGLRITTTVNKAYQDAAVAAVADVMAGEPDNLREALVAVDPRTGGVLAYYGNPAGSGEGVIDYAQAQRQPGSSMKPYVLATALEEGISVNARRDGSSPQRFPDRTQPVRNSGNAQCAACTLKDAITRSLNTTYYGLAYEVGAEAVRETALRATGLPETWEGGNLEGDRTLADASEGPTYGQTGSAIGIGQYEMRPVDQAVGFATFANGGTYRPAHFVAQVADSSGAVLKTNDGSAGAQPAIPADVASDVTFALEGVADFSKRSLAGDRPVASKTGTQGLNDEDNSDAWMVGYTPSISAAVWMGSDSPSEPITNAQGRIIYGSGLPGAIWQEFMDTALAGTPEEPLPTKAIIRGDTGEGVPEPTTQAPVTTSQAPAPTTEAPAPTSSAEESDPADQPGTTGAPPTPTGTPPAGVVPTPRGPVPTCGLPGLPVCAP